MTFDDFDKFQNKLFSECFDIAQTKGKEYANGADRMGNFNRLSERLGISPEQVLYVYLTKHLDAIESYVKTGKVMSEEGIRGRITDAITYLTILAGMAESSSPFNPSS